jgi:hypothetical protein
VNEAAAPLLFRHSSQGQSGFAAQRVLGEAVRAAFGTALEGLDGLLLPGDRPAMRLGHREHERLEVRRGGHREILARHG